MGLTTKSLEVLGAFTPDRPILTLAEVSRATGVPLTTTARMLAHICQMAGHTPGLTTTDGVYVNGQRTVEGDMTGPVSARMGTAFSPMRAKVLR